jgi:hypothetical protein
MLPLSTILLSHLALVRGVVLHYIIGGKIEKDILKGSTLSGNSISVFPVKRHLQR